MRRNTTKGLCNLCGNKFTKTGMTRHLQSCISRQLQSKQDTPGNKTKKPDSIVVSVEGRYCPQYWLYLELPIHTELIELDQFLRNIWLECCGHMSAYHIRGEDYSISPDFTYEERDMDIALTKVLGVGEYFTYEYDFGTTTELILKVIGVFNKTAAGGKIAILARNDEPRYSCDYCENTAVEICIECNFDGKGWLCEKCVEKHECDEELLLPVVNSPRVGTCGYTG